ncbi:MAG: exosome complex protein Rrp42 [Candidatus Altiarchaeales archaeon]|nr:exosome complex protein Rrp42 [Candidatus Altiarchaeales archaeon]MBD3416508.1 exosome complex protein Rrp42 [Candidatus Altiarchaeales archaeon]
MNIESFIKGDYVKSIVSEGSRTDGRGFDDMRKLEIEKGYVGEKSSGSAYVRLGKTEVLAGISMDMGEPYPDSPTSGVMTTSTELRPIASPYFESGPPREESIEVARVVDRGIRESGAIDVDSLLIEEGKVWIVFMDLHILNFDGNLFDACSYAAAAALRDSRLPKIEDGTIVRGEWDGKLPVTCTPVSFTFGKIGSNILLDPCSDEEYALDTRLTVTTTDTVNAMQKGGNGSFKPEEAKDCVSKAFKKAPEIRKILEG